MFEKWKASRVAKRATKDAEQAAKERIERDSYLRRLRNSARALTGTTHSGPGHNDALDPYEIRAVLREKLRESEKADGGEQGERA